MISINSYKEYFNGVIKEGSEEFKIISEVYNILSSRLPSTAAEAYSRVSSLESYRAQISTMIYVISMLRDDINREYRKLYEKEFTKLSLLNRPSQAAIDAEIHSKSTEAFMLRDKLESYDRILQLLNSYIRCIDSSKSSAVEAWRDSRRV